MTNHRLPRQLDSIKQEAKALQRSFASGDLASRDRIALYFPNESAPSLQQIQLVVAREYGFDSWSKLKARFAESMRREISPSEPQTISVGRTPPGMLTDGRVTLRLPDSNDVPRIVDYGKDEKLLEGIWIPGPFPGSDLEAWAQNTVSEAIAGWADEGSILGGGLAIDEEQPFVGIINLVPRGNDAIEIGVGVAPPVRGRGIATRALCLITDWALAHGGFSRVELRMDENQAASRRVAEKAGFRLQERFETYVEGTGETYIDVLYSRAPGDNG